MVPLLPGRIKTAVAPRAKRNAPSGPAQAPRPRRREGHLRRQGEAAGGRRRRQGWWWSARQQGMDALRFFAILAACLYVLIPHFGNAISMAGRGCARRMGQASRLCQVEPCKPPTTQCGFKTAVPTNGPLDDGSGLVAAAGTTTWAVFRVSFRRCGS